MFKKVFSLALLLMFVLCACEETPEEIPVTGVALGQDRAEMLIGETLQLKVQITPSNATDQSVMWASGKQSVATVSDAGLVTAVGEGTATITATAGGKKATCEVIVTKPFIKVESVTLEQTEIALTKGETLKLKATVKPDNATDATVIWTSADEAVAKVDQSGEVTATGTGSTVITATAGEKSAECTVTVTVPAESVELDCTVASLFPGQTLNLTATVLPDDVTDKSVTWASTNPDIAEVDQEGKVTAKSVGTVTITATTTDGGLIAGCEVSVVEEYIPLTAIILSQTEITLARYKSVELEATLVPENATMQTLAWITSDTGVAYANRTENNLIASIMGTGKGTATITVAGADGVSATCSVTVNVPVDAVELSQRTALLSVGETVTLTATVYPDDADDLSVSWSTSNAGVATVDGGTVTAVAEGSATITATAGGQSVSCTVTVEKAVIHVESVTLDKTQVDMHPDDQITLVATVLPDDAHDPTVTWTTSNADVVTVEGGKLTAVAEGEAVITAIAEDKSATCTVTVSRQIVHVESVILSSSNENMEVGSTLVLTATVLPENADDKSVTWASTNPSIAAVDQTGTVTAMSEGTVTIYATTTDGEKVAGCEVTVAPAFIPVESITFEYPELIAFLNDPYPLNVTVLHENATNKTVIWTSSNPSVLSVTAGGMVTARREGIVEVTARAGDKSDVCIIHCVINPDSPDQRDGEENGHWWVDLDLPSGLMWATCNVGASSSLEAGDMFAWGEITVKNSYDWSNYRWGTGETNKVSKYNTKAQYGAVDNKTLLDIEDDAANAIWGGNWHIPSKQDAQELFDNCRLELVEINGSKYFKFISKSNNHFIVMPCTYFYEENNYYNGEYWTSSLYSDRPIQAHILDFDNSAMKFGVADRSFPHPVRAVLGDMPVQEIPVETLNLSHSEILMDRGEEFTLRTEVLPYDATDRTVTWESDNPQVVSVDAKGNLKALKKGRAYITAKAGAKTRGCDVQVLVRVHSIELNRTTLELEKGESFDLRAQVIPTDADQQNVYWSSSDESVAHVNNIDGMLHASKEGTAVITAMEAGTVDGVKGFCTVTVKPYSGAPAIILEQETFVVDSDASSDNIIKSRIANPPSGAQLQATVSPEGNGWLSAYVVAGALFNVTENKSTLSRTAQITLTYGPATATVTIKQKGCAPTGPTDIVFDGEIDPEANNGVHPSGEYETIFYARVENPVEGVEMEMSSDVPWITNIRPSTNSYNTYCFTASKNTTGRARTGHVILTYGNVTKTIKFVQQADHVNIGLTPADMTFNYEARTVSFEVNLPEGYDYGGLTAEPDDYYTWIKNVAINGNTVTFDLRENNDRSMSDRSGRIKVSLNGESSYFNVTQTFDAPEINMPTSYKLSYLRQVVHIAAQVTNPRSEVGFEPRVLDSPGWIYANPGGTFTVVENTTGKDRTAQVEVTYGWYLKKTLTVTQTMSGTEIRPAKTSESCPSEGENWTFDVLVYNPLQYTDLEVTASEPWLVIKKMTIKEFPNCLSYTIYSQIKKNYWPEERTAVFNLKYGDFSNVITITQAPGDEMPVGFMDLGLPSGTLWSMTNLGAANEYNIGGYYAWGETTAKTYFIWNNYKWGRYGKVTKYNASDGKTILDAGDDAATAVDPHWSIPTEAQWQELTDNCEYEWVMTPVEGARFTSKINGESIFLPGAGSKFDNDPVETECMYWTKELSGDSNGALLFYSGDGYYGMGADIRCFGMPIRPVRHK